MEKERKSNFLTILKRKNDFGLLFIKNPFFQCRFVSDNFIRHFFIVCQLFNKTQNQCNIISLCISKINF